jgi:hypothetical protein
VSDEYDEAAKKLLEAYQGTIGQAANGIAERNDNVEWSDGEITSFNGQEEELGELIEDYRDIMGDVAYTLARQNLEDIKPENIQK